MVSQNDEMEAPSLLNGDPRCHKGPAAEGVALKIFAAPPQGEPGVSRSTDHALQNLKTQAGPAPLRRPLPKVFQKSSIFELQFQHTYFHARFAESMKIDSKRDPFWKPNSAKVEQKHRPGSNRKNTFEKLEKIMQQVRPNTSQIKHFA